MKKLMKFLIKKKDLFNGRMIILKSYGFDEKICKELLYKHNGNLFRVLNDYHLQKELNVNQNSIKKEDEINQNSIKKEDEININQNSIKKDDIIVIEEEIIDN